MLAPSKDWKFFTTASTECKLADAAVQKTKIRCVRVSQVYQNEFETKRDTVVWVCRTGLLLINLYGCIDCAPAADCSEGYLTAISHSLVEEE
jgi:hypothetical protein